MCSLCLPLKPCPLDERNEVPGLQVGRGCKFLEKYYSKRDKKDGRIKLSRTPLCQECIISFMVNIFQSPWKGHPLWCRGQHLTLPQAKYFSGPILVPSFGELCTTRHTETPSAGPSFPIFDFTGHWVIRVITEHNFYTNCSSRRRKALATPGWNNYLQHILDFFFFCWVSHYEGLPIHMWTVNKLTDGILLYKRFQIHYSFVAVSVVYSIRKPQIRLKVRQVRISAKHLHNIYP